ncbi:RNA polymerase sigma factor [Labilibacter marinus]|uniref:RNA polymerase sigma factor n=1 Tax=Labilibacter marinus TaxID=1477105 RepID=UPI00082C0E89|nr:sigma-70 family RNA polymerase sigma factor [Labilibacter marinus]
MLSVFSRNKVLSDQDIIKKYKQTNDLDLLGDLYGRYMDLVFGVCLKYLKDKEAAQDAVIYVFEKIAVSIKNTEVENFKPWLYVIAKNYCLMQLRKIKHNEVSIDEGDFFLGKIMESDFDVHPIDKEDEERNEEALRNCIEKLKLAQKQSIELFYFEKLSYQQISDKMQIEVKKVKSYIQNAKRNLKMCLENNAE